MSKAEKLLGLGVVVAIVLAIIGINLPKQLAPQAGAVIATTDLNATNIVGEGTFSVGVLTPLLQLGVGTAAGSIQEQVSTGSCNTGTSTVFAVANPFSATSTAILQNITGIGNATSSNLLVGTSTASTGLSASSVSATMANVTVGTSTPQFYVSSGSVGGGYYSGAGTFREIVVGPSENVVAQATSTYGNAGALNYSPAFTSCTYKILWHK